MKKFYFLAFAMIGFVANAQTTLIDDDMESYPLGLLHQAHWSSWSGNAGAEDIEVVNTQASSGTQSGYVGAGQGPQDVLLLLGNKTSGTLTLEFKMFIPTGKTGYFNIQGTTSGGGAGGGGNGVFNSPNLVFNNTQSASGAPGTGGAYPNIDDANPTYSWTYPENTWFDVQFVFDLGVGQWTMSIDGTALAPQPFDAENVVGAIDFFAIDANNEYFIDDVLYVETTAGVNDFSETAFEIYPNPVVNYLNILSNEKIARVEVYSILGERILEVRPDKISPKIDVRQLQPGAYLVKITGETGSETIRVLK